MKWLALPLLGVALLLPACKTAPPTAGGDYKTVDPLVDRDTDEARRLNQQAAQFIEQGELKAAEELLKHALELDVRFGPAHNNLGKVYFDQDRLYLAAWEFQYAAKLMPNHAEPKNNLGLALEAGHKLDEAIDHYTAAHQLEPDHAEVIGNLVRARIKRGDRGAEVRDLLQQLIAKDTRPDWVQWAKERLATMGS